RRWPATYFERFADSQNFATYPEVLRIADGNEHRDAARGFRGVNRGCSGYVVVEATGHDHRWRELVSPPRVEEARSGRPRFRNSPLGRPASVVGRGFWQTLVKAAEIGSLETRKSSQRAPPGNRCIEVTASPLQPIS